MINKRVGELHRKLRHRALLSQQALSERCGVARWKISRLEMNDLDTLRLAEVDRCLSALGAELEIRGIYRGAAADRLVDEGHAAIVARVVEILHGLGWEAHVEVSFNRWGERGSYDVLAWHAEAGALVVIEVKTELGSLESTLRTFDVKGRLCRAVAKETFGWAVSSVAKALVLPEMRATRRDVERHAVLLRTALPATSRQLHAWLRAPGGDIAAIWFVSAGGGATWRVNPSAIRRIRRPRHAPQQ